jgi:hypothetical protein
VELKASRSPFAPVEVRNIQPQSTANLVASEGEQGLLRTPGIKLSTT